MRLHALSQVACGVDRASHLIEQLLRLARLDPLYGVVEGVSFDLGQLAQDVVDELGPAAREKNQRLSFTPPAIAAQLQGDPEMLRLAIRNLVENAIRYTPRDGNVAAGIDNGSGPIRFWVRDSGPGIMVDDLPHLTERFYRGHNVTAEGSGLGLAIAKRVAELSRAQLHLRNMREGGLEAALEWGLPGKLDS